MALSLRRSQSSKTCLVQGLGFRGFGYRVLPEIKALRNIPELRTSKLSKIAKGVWVSSFGLLLTVSVYDPSSIQRQI